MSGPVPWLPFLTAREHRSLTKVGEAIVPVPTNLVFNLFLSSGCAHIGRYNARRGVKEYNESIWEADREHQYEGLLRTVCALRSRSARARASFGSRSLTFRERIEPPVRL